MSGRVVSGDEVARVADAVRALGVGDLEAVVLADHPGRRRVVRIGDVVVKAFSPAERSAFERELAGLRALAGTGLAVALVGDGERWVATRRLDGVVPMSTAIDGATIHGALGSWLARLHAVPPTGLAPWSVVDRLRARLSTPPETCPPALVRAVADAVDPLLATVRDPTTFVHGDWGTANVLLVEGEVGAIIDLEDAHAGDPAEDFKWQVLAGAASGQVAWMGSTYVAAGGRLGPHAVERLVVAGAELCLDVAGWGLPSHARRSVATLDELVTGQWPDWSE